MLIYFDLHPGSQIHPIAQWGIRRPSLLGRQEWGCWLPTYYSSLKSNSYFVFVFWLNHLISSDTLFVIWLFENHPESMFMSELKFWKLSLGFHIKNASSSGSTFMFNMFQTKIILQEKANPDCMRQKQYW